MLLHSLYFEVKNCNHNEAGDGVRIVGGDLIVDN